MIDALKSLLLGSVATSAAKQINLTDIIAAVRHAVSIALMSALALFVFQTLHGLEVHDWGVLEPVATAILAGLTKLAIRYFKDYQTTNTTSLPVHGGSRRVD